MGLDCVWYQTMGTGSYKAWIRFGSGRWVVRLDERIVGFIIMWARVVCDQFWVSVVICFHCLLLFYSVFVFFFVLD